MELNEKSINDIATSVWQTALNMDIVACDPFRFEETERVVSSISFDGGLRGKVAIESTRDCAELMASVMLDMDIDELQREDMEDAFCEITNITAGGIKSVANGDFQLSIPEFGDGADDAACEKRTKVGFRGNGCKLNITVEGDNHKCNWNTINVLLLEASRVSRRMISSSLDSVYGWNFKLESCDSIQGALDSISRNSPDVVLIDLTLRESHDLETCATIRTHAPQTPVIVLTSENDENFAFQVLKSGAQDHILMAELAPALLSRSITYSIERCNADADRESLQKRLIDASIQAGIAEMATGILHNVGNVLNSVNVSATLIERRLRQSQIEKFVKLSAVVTEHEENLVDFFARDKRGKMLPKLLRKFVEALTDDQKEIQNEVKELKQNISHINNIVSAQQQMARPVGLQVQLDLRQLSDRAVKMHESMLEERDVQIVREYSEVPNIWTDQHKALQILENLVKNGIESINENRETAPRLIVRVGSNKGMVFVELEDSGVGIEPDNLTKLFQHGFTTKSTGHGFGLHSCAISAKILHGNLTCESEGLGHGATFRLELPVDRRASESRSRSNDLAELPNVGNS